MNETLTNFRQAVADSTDLQEKVKAGADLVALGKENGYEFATLPVYGPLRVRGLISLDKRLRPDVNMLPE